jgi:hypothetical protein
MLVEFEHCSSVAILFVMSSSPHRGNGNDKIYLLFYWINLVYWIWECAWDFLYRCIVLRCWSFNIFYVAMFIWTLVLRNCTNITGLTLVWVMRLQLCITLVINSRNYVTVNMPWWSKNPSCISRHSFARPTRAIIDCYFISSWITWSAT